MTIDFVGLGLTIMISASIGLVAYYIVTILMKNIEQSAMIEQLKIDNSAYAKKFSELVEEKQKLELVQTDGFVSFVSKSRDWAFTYIEEVQSTLNKFVETVGPTMEYYDKFGRIDENPPMNKIFDAYSELIKVLPESNEKQGETK
jgi:hypothetical protein